MSHFKAEDFARSKRVESAGGTVQPIKVHPIECAAAGLAKFEVVYGHLRHQALVELGLSALALLPSDMKGAELFVDMERENREREDLSEWEQGVMYIRALEQDLFPSAKGNWTPRSLATWATSARRPEGVLATSRELLRRGCHPFAGGGLPRFTAQGEVPRQALGSTREWKDDDGKPIAFLFVDWKGRRTFLRPAHGEALRRKLVHDD